MQSGWTDAHISTLIDEVIWSPTRHEAEVIYGKDNPFVDSLMEAKERKSELIRQLLEEKKNKKQVRDEDIPPAN